jgi:uncharacterized MAPEG superfamily protein
VNTYPALPAFAFALVALFLKTTLTSVLQVTGRVRTRTVLLPEDAAMFGLRTKTAESPFVQRCTNVWRNDVENLPLFIALALTYVLLGASLESAQWLFGTYVLLRYAHTVVYLRGLQPWRVLVYYAGLTVCWVIAFRILLLALN